MDRHCIVVPPEDNLERSTELFSSPDTVAMLLHKVAGKYGIGMIEPDVHMYVAQMAATVFPNPSYGIDWAEYIVNSTPDLVRRTTEGKHANSPLFQYLTGMLSGNFHLCHQSMPHVDTDIQQLRFIASCYAIAKQGNERRGKKNLSRVFDSLRQNPEHYHNLLSAYYSNLQNPTFGLTKEDLDKFMDFFLDQQREPLIDLDKQRTALLLTRDLLEIH